MRNLNFVWLGLVLSLASCRGNLPLGAKCSSNRQCAGKLVCDANAVCAKGNCVGVGGKCSTNDDCCGTLFCSNRTCH